METELNFVSQLVGNGVLASVLLWLLMDERKEAKKAREEHLFDMRKAISDKSHSDGDK